MSKLRRLGRLRKAGADYKLGDFAAISLMRRLTRVSSPPPLGGQASIGSRRYSQAAASILRCSRRQSGRYSHRRGRETGDGVRVLHQIAPLAVVLASAGPVWAQERLSPSNSWVTIADYPTEALGKGDHGSVSVEIAISATGAVESCRTIYKSAPQALADATCKAISSRALYRPAHDKNGQPTIGKDTLSFEWIASDPSVRVSADFGGSIPANSPGYWATDNDYNAIVAAVGSADVGIKMRIGPDGRMAACGAYQSSGNAKLDNYTCALVASRAHFIQPTDDQGQPMTTIGQIVVKWKKPGGR